jgi:hypothetical protein
MLIVLRYALFLLAGFLMVNLFLGRRRAAPLVASGRLTQEELDRFARGCALIFGGFFLGGGTLQLLAGYPDPFCLATFPPRNGYGLALWLGQTALSGRIVWWLWAHDGARILAAVAPAFTNGPVLTRTYAPRTVRLFVTAVVVLGPLGNILVQVNQPLLSGCVAV